MNFQVWNHKRGKWWDLGKICKCKILCLIGCNSHIPFSHLQTLPLLNCSFWFSKQGVYNDDSRASPSSFQYSYYLRVRTTWGTLMGNCVDKVIKSLWLPKEITQSIRWWLTSHATQVISTRTPSTWEAREKAFLLSPTTVLTRGQLLTPSASPSTLTPPLFMLANHTNLQLLTMMLSAPIKLPPTANQTSDTRAIPIQTVAPPPSDISPKARPPITEAHPPSAAVAQIQPTVASIQLPLSSIYQTVDLQEYFHQSGRIPFDFWIFKISMESKMPSFLEYFQSLVMFDSHSETILIINWNFW